MYWLLGSLAPSVPFSGGPPGIPGRPRPAPPKNAAPPVVALPDESRLVVAGVITLAGRPLVGAEDGWVGEIVTGDDWIKGF